MFKDVLDELEALPKFLINKNEIENIKGNTTKENLRNFNINHYFDNEVIKNTFAKKYIEIMDRDFKGEEFIPEWVKGIKEFF